MNELFSEGQLLKGEAETEIYDYEKFRDIVKATYIKNGVGLESIDQFVKHNKQVEDFVVKYSELEEFDKKETEIATLAAIFHDITKGWKDFLKHGEDGGEIAEEILKENGVSPELAYSVRLAIERHMRGEKSYLGRTAIGQYGEKFRFPTPETRVAQMVYECDVLTQLTPEGFEKILFLRENDEENRQEDERVATEKGMTKKEAKILSALQSAKESFEFIKMKSIKEDANIFWDETQEKYRDILEK